MRTHFEPELAKNLDDNFSNIGGGGRGGFGGGRPMGGGGMRTPMGGGVRTPSPRTAPSAPRTRSSSPTVPSSPSAPRTRSSSPSTSSAPSFTRSARTTQQQHNRMVRRGLRPYYGGGYGRGYRRFGMTPYGRRWWLGGNGWLFGYDYNFWYPFFYDLSLGVYEEEVLKEKYNISDEDWDILMDKLIRGKYINYNY